MKNRIAFVAMLFLGLVTLRFVSNASADDFYRSKTIHFVGAAAPEFSGEIDAQKEELAAQRCQKNV